MRLMELWIMKFAAKCPPGKRGRPMSKSPEAAEAAGFEVCEKETRDGRTVAYKTGRQLEKEKEARSEKQSLRKEAGISSKGRISKANLQKLNDLKAKLDSLKAIQVEQEGALESKVEEGHPEFRKKDEPAKIEEKRGTVEAVENIDSEGHKISAKFSEKPSVPDGYGVQEFENDAKLKYFEITKTINRKGNKSKPYIANLDITDGKIDRDFYKYGDDMIVFRTDEPFVKSHTFNKKQHELYGDVVGNIRATEYRNADEDFKRYVIFDYDNNTIKEYTESDLSKNDLLSILKQENDFWEKKVPNAVFSKLSSAGENIKSEGVYIQESPDPERPKSKVIRNEIRGSSLKDGDEIEYQPYFGMKVKGTVKDGKIYADSLPYHNIGQSSKKTIKEPSEIANKKVRSVEDVPPEKKEHYKKIIGDLAPKKDGFSWGNERTFGKLFKKDKKGGSVGFYDVKEGDIVYTDSQGFRVPFEIGKHPEMGYITLKPMMEEIELI